MGFGDQPMGQPDRINGTWQLRRISSVVVNGDTENVHTLYQKDTHKGIILSTPLLLPLKKGENTITVSGLWNGFDYKGADLDRIVVYPPEGVKKRWFWDLPVAHWGHPTPSVITWLCYSCEYFVY
ncbi:hypothetical protein BDV35DRAFT_388452 [Aspergillus flavus]|uniref:Uncharacterized protein n=1 Tax=Aspergillus flavus TaxID=5059 RepID=A0A5N6HEN9_ASPFL|nr:hypothetical protein BDV35DRAFT_388452 [Aspergillus flavus]